MGPREAQGCSRRLPVWRQEPGCSALWGSPSEPYSPPHVSPLPPPPHLRWGPEENMPGPCQASAEQGQCWWVWLFAGRKETSYQEGRVAPGAQGSRHGDRPGGPPPALCRHSQSSVPGRSLSVPRTQPSVCASAEGQCSTSRLRARMTAGVTVLPSHVEGPGRRSPWTAPSLADRGYYEHLRERAAPGTEEASWNSVLTDA